MPASAPSPLGEKVDDTMDAAAGVGQRVQRHPAYRWLVRIGLCCYGLVHLLLALLCERIAFGARVEASNQGTLRTVASWHGGRLLIGVIGLGMAGLVVWMVLEAAFGYPWFDRRTRLVRRISCAFRAVVYLTLVLATAHLLLGQRVTPGNTQAQHTSRTLFSLPGGNWLVALVGVGVAVAAVDQVSRGLRQTFVRYDLADDPPTWARRLGVVGWVTKGLSLALVAVVFWVAAAHHDARRVGGLDMALRTFGTHTPGRIVLCAMACGFAAFGVFCFAWAPRARHDAAPDPD